MASITQGQDIVRCHLCSNPVEHHCNLCHVNLCTTCIPKHMSDKTKRHEVVEFINRKGGPVLPECKSHNKTLCELYCNDCNEPTCVYCVTSSHKKHDVTNIKIVLENLKQRIIADVEELENSIGPKFRIDGTKKVSMENFDKVIRVIQAQEDKICRVVREIASHLEDEVGKQKREFEQQNKEAQFSSAKKDRELSKIIQQSKNILDSNNAASILCYHSRNGEFRYGPKHTTLACPTFVTGKVAQNQLLEMFGSLQNRSSVASYENTRLLNLMSNPFVVSTIKSPFEYSILWMVLCEGRGNIWVCGSANKIYQMDGTGSMLNEITTAAAVFSMSLNKKGELTFSLRWPDKKIYKYNGSIVTTLLVLSAWCPLGHCHAVNGDLLVSMRSIDFTESRIVRFSGTTETTIIQKNSQGQPLFSVGDDSVLFLAENGNGDICVSDGAGGSVVVVDASGHVRFNYFGNVSKQSKDKSFKPGDIATDVNHQILVNDSANIVHVINCEGNFLRYIEYPCLGGVSIDSEHNLVIGDQDTGEIRVIKYLQ